MANLDLIYSPDDRMYAFENHTDGFLISLAGPGTGKTHSFLKRTKALITCGVPQDSICYLTFIKEISNAFIEDYIEEFGRDSYETNKPRISTLHSFACRLLRNQGFQIGYDQELYFTNTADKDSDDANTVLSDLLEFVKGPLCLSVADLRKHVNCIKKAWRDEVNPLSLPDPVPMILPHAKRLFKALRIVDWDQTIQLALILARSLQQLPSWITNLKHYFIDEYQDFNKAEQTLIGFLSNYATSTVIVGDDDQSLYRTRGGSPDGLRSLYADPTKDHVSLIKCYRCRETIVTAANTFQRGMSTSPRTMIPVHSGGEILAYRFKSSKAEVTFLVPFLLDCIAQLPETITPKDGTVCLFPSWKVLDEYYKQLSPYVPCIRRKRTPNSQRIWLERVLNLLCTPNQRFIERLLLNEYDQIKPRHKRSIIQKVIQDDLAVPRAVQLLLTQNQITKDAAIHAQQFCQLIEDIGSRDPDKISQQLASKLSIDSSVVHGHISSLIMKLAELETEDLIKEFADLILPTSAIPEEDPRSILFLTMHGSKGLTKRVVVMPGLERAWLPGDSAGAELEEKQRLFFVSLTRATHRVLVTVPKNRGKGDSLNYTTPGRGEVSPFLENSGICIIYQD